MSPTDHDLVDRCRNGDHDAFATIVQRYQNLVCSIAYSSTGSLSLSEELAQETFVAAWHSLGKLRRPDRLRPWLCGIVRNLARNLMRKRRHDVLQRAATVDDSHAATGTGGDPVETAITREEAAIMQRTLESIPEAYREPLVLYYREEQSVKHVAELLGLSEDAVRQRLVRGRKLVRSEIAAVVERGLRRSAPGRAFTMGVLAALPAMGGTAKAAMMTATSAKGASAMQAAGWTGVWGAIVGPLVGLAGAWFGVTMSLKSARSERERAFIVKSTWWLAGLVAAFAIGVTALLLFGQDFVRESPTGFATAVVVLTGGYTLALIGAIVYGNRRLARIRREDGTLDMSASEAAANLPGPLRRWQYPAVYESPLRIFGLPLVSIRFNGALGDSRHRRPAVGWIAIGDKAYGLLFAAGSVAVGGVAVGAIGIGVISFAGLALGLLPIGGVAVGWMAAGGIGMGYLAFGGCALALQAATGGLAVSRGIAVGGLAVAPNANDAIAKQFVDDSAFFQLSGLLATHAWLWTVFVAAFFVALLWARKKAEQPPST